MQYIVTNFAYGTGPYLRTTDLAVAFNNELEKRGQARMGIIVPWVYGERQKRIMLEEFAGHDQMHPGEIFLDAGLGALLKSVFYGDMIYEETLERWAYAAKAVSRKAHEHLSGTLRLETLPGAHVQANGKDIAIELNRSPRIRYDVAPSYFTSFGYVAEILERAKGVSEIAVAPESLEKGVAIANWVERDQRMHAIAYPATFSYLSTYKARYPGECIAPPIAPPPMPNTDDIARGIFVTITGIPGLERLYGDAKRLGLKLYSNDTDAVPGSTRLLPYVIPNKNILFQFARSGWSSVWISMISGTPLVVPEFDAKDDPEIYFNNCAVEALGVGIIYRGQPLEDILKESDRVRASSARLVEVTKARWGTLDGNQYCAQLFVDDFLNC